MHLYWAVCGRLCVPLAFLLCVLLKNPSSPHANIHKSVMFQETSVPLLFLGLVLLLEK